MAFALAIGALVLLAAQAAAQDGASVAIGEASAEPGAEATVELTAGGVADPGLGAWSIDVTYDDSVVTAVSCDPAVSGATNVCNEAFADDTVRVAGASATGLDGANTLASITFECGDDAGTSTLEITLVHFADATIGGPQPVDAEVTNGSITCEGEAAGLPDAGQGFSSNGGALYALVGLLAALGLAVLGRGYLAFRSA